LVKVGEGGMVIMTERERAEQRESAFGKLEKTIADRQRLEDAKERIGELQDAAERQWEDPYAQNQRLRKAFRVGRHEREREGVRTEELKDRMSLGIDLLPETAEDSTKAALVEFGSSDFLGRSGSEEDGDGRLPPIDEALARPLFEPPLPIAKKDERRSGTSSPIIAGARSVTTTGGKKDSSKPARKLLKYEIAASRMRENLVSEIVNNTRAAKDPFLDFGSKSAATSTSRTIIPGLKRKRTATTEEVKSNTARDPPSSITNEKAPPVGEGRAVEGHLHIQPMPVSTTTASSKPSNTPLLVAYSSDSD